MIVIRPLICVLAIILSAGHAAAFGLSMHGQPKYDETSTHLEYANPDAPKGGTKKEAAIGTFDTLNPYAIQGKAAAGLNLFYDSLSVRVWDEPFSLYPLIASSLDMPDDRSSLTITIDPAARFHDGTPVSAEDILFSFETLRDHGRPNMRAVYKLVNNISVLDDGRIRFTFGDGYDRETAMIVAMMPVLSKSWWSQHEFSKTILDIPNGNGPYRIAEIDPGRRIVYERDPDYWAADHFASAGHYNFDTIIYDYYRDSSVAFEAFKAGDLNIRRETDITKWNSAYDDNAQDYKRSQIKHGRPERARGFIFNMRREPFDDIRVRQALNLLFDFEWINKNLYGGAYNRISSIYPNAVLGAQNPPSQDELSLLDPYKDALPPSVFGSAYTPARNATPRDIRSNRRMAAQLLDDAGWRVESGRRVKDGDTLEFELMLDNPEDEKIALHFQRALEREGITMQIRVLDTAAFRGRLNEYDFDMVSYYWLSSLSPGTEQLLYWSCDAANQKARWNFSGICHPAIDHIAGAMATTTSYDELITHARALDRIIMHNHVMVPLYYGGADRFAHGKEIHRPQETPLYGAVLESWWMEKPAN